MMDLLGSVAKSLEELVVLTRRREEREAARDSRAAVRQEVDWGRTSRELPWRRRLGSEKPEGSGKTAEEPLFLSDDDEGEKDGNVNSESFVNSTLK
jgi:hypothetical protein